MKPLTGMYILPMIYFPHTIRVVIHFYGVRMNEADSYNSYGMRKLCNPQVRRPIGTAVELIIPPFAVVVLIGLK